MAQGKVTFSSRPCPGRNAFLESHGYFSCPESCFMFAVFAFKIKVSIILKVLK